MLSRQKGLTVVLSLLCVSIIILITHLSAQPGKQATKWVQSLQGHSGTPCADKLDRLDELDLTYPLFYARRDIIVNFSPHAKRAPVTKVREKLFPDLQSIDFYDTAPRLQHCREPLVLDVQTSTHEAGEASHVMFGMSTTLQRLNASIPQLSRWLPNTSARLFIVVIESEEHEEVEAVAADSEKKRELQTRMRGLDMDVTLVDPLKLQDTFAERYFSLIKVLYGNRDDRTQWISTIDDDTFFPSMHALVSMLKKYDPDKEHYVGSLSEEWSSVMLYGLMAFGGAGVFISVPLAKNIADNYDFCKGASGAPAGDIRIMECINELTDTKLANEHNLHQVDLYGDLSGIFESGRMPLSLHHWKPGAATVDGYDLPKMHQVADVCQVCFLQRWQFDNDMILSNGFSIARYPTGSLRGAKIDRVESTWAAAKSVEGSNNHGVDHSLGPTRPQLGLDDEKIQYRLMHSKTENGSVRQSYYHRGLNGDADTLLELFWRKGDDKEDHVLESRQI